VTTQPHTGQPWQEWLEAQDRIQNQILVSFSLDRHDTGLCLGPPSCSLCVRQRKWYRRLRSWVRWHMSARQRHE